MLVLVACVFLSFLSGTTQKSAGPPVSWQSRDPGHISVSEAVTARDCCLYQSVRPLVSTRVTMESAL